jgi:lysophospholipase L1-like esterase
MQRRLAALCAAVALCAPATAAAQTTEPVPKAMSAVGDSITRAFNACGWFYDCTARSWSTGDYSSVNSHFLRIRRLNPSLTRFNDARSGAKMADLNGQVTTVVGRGVDYVTILMGANDACTSSESTMTPVTTFRSQFAQAMATLTGGLPNARILVVSVPDVKRLWEIGKNSSSARSAWDGYGICQSMLANPTSTQQADVDRRDRVRQRVVDFNTQLAQVCALYAKCRFDGNAVFNYPFVLSQVSSWDYFHPNTAGQQVLADVTYRAGFGW